MTKQAGQLCTVSLAGTTIAGGRTSGISWNGTPIDVSDKGSNAFQEFLDGVLATDTLEVTLDGLEEDQVLRDKALSTVPANKFLPDLSFNFPNGDKLSGKFILTTYTETGAHDGAQEFTATFVRNGAHTYPGGA